MKTTCNWLREYCDHGLAPEEMAHRLTMAGCSVEGITPRGDDYVVAVEVTANRPDLLGTIGIARELAVLTDKPLRKPQFSLPTDGEPIEKRVAVEVLDWKLCPRYTARLITGARVGPSPAWLADRLEMLGIRPVNNIVDIGNYVMLGCGQPLHAFDFDRLARGRIVVRRARKGEKLVTIDGGKRDLTEDMLVIADAQSAVAIAGIMGGLETEIANRTTNILIESAQFENTQIRRTSRKLGLASDSSYRFERVADVAGCDWASAWAAHLMLEVAGGQLAAGLVDAWALPPAPRKASLRFSRLNQVLGLDVPRERVVQILNSLEFTPAPVGGKESVAVAVPSFRADVTQEVDLIEEVARIYGYDKIPEKSELRLVSAVNRTRAERVSDELRACLSHIGFHETISNSFVTASQAALFSPWTEEAPLRFNNTIRADENLLRVSILPSLLAVKAANAAHGSPKSDLFEIGAAYLPATGRPQPREQSCLAILCENGFLALKGVVEVVLQMCGVQGGLELKPYEHTLFEPGRAAQMMLDGKALWHMGELCKSLSDEMGFRSAPALAELNLNLLIEAAVLERRLTPLPVYPASSRDIAAVVDEGVTWGQVETCARAALPAGSYLEEARFFDLYRGKQVPEGKKSLAFTIIFRAPDRTLTGEEVDEAWKRVVTALERQLGATLRTVTGVTGAAS